MTKSPRLRWWVAGATAAYLLPLAVSVTTYAAHDFYHFRELVGVAPTSPPGAGVGPGEFVHEHGDGEHSHDAATNALLVAAEHADEPADEHHAPALELVSHLPADGGMGVISVPVGAAPRLEPDLTLTAFPAPPLLPPPRV